MPIGNHQMKWLKSGIVQALWFCIKYTFHSVVPDYSSLDLPRIRVITLSFTPKGNHQMTKLKTGVVQDL